MNQIKRYLIVLCALALMPIVAGATVSPGGNASAPVYHSEIEQDIATMTNLIRDEYGLSALELRTSTNGELNSEFQTYRDCIMGINARRTLEDGQMLTHSGCVPDGSTPYAAPAKIWAVVGGSNSYSVGSTVTGLHGSPGHRKDMISDADFMFIYSACYTIDSEPGNDYLLTMISFGKNNGSVPTPNVNEPYIDITNGLAYGDIPDKYRSSTYHGCNGGSSVPLEPAAGPSAGGPTLAGPPATVPGEPELSTSTPQLWYRYQISRLYSAYFGRNPDSEGWTYWNGQFISGQSLRDMSSFFAGSTEFIGRYGSLSDSEFVNLVYENVLGRQGEASGVAYWTGRLSSEMSRGELMIGFSESIEFIYTDGDTATGAHWVATSPTDNTGIASSYWNAANDTVGL